jgi:hypothetical protein
MLIKDDFGIIRSNYNGMSSQSAVWLGRDVVLLGVLAAIPLLAIMYFRVSQRNQALTLELKKIQATKVKNVVPPDLSKRLANLEKDLLAAKTSALNANREVNQIKASMNLLEKKLVDIIDKKIGPLEISIEEKEQLINKWGSNITRCLWTSLSRYILKEQNKDCNSEPATPSSSRHGLLSTPGSSSSKSKARVPFDMQSGEIPIFDLDTFTRLGLNHNSVFGLGDPTATTEDYVDVGEDSDHDLPLTPFTMTPKRVRLKVTDSTASTDTSSSDTSLTSGDTSSVASTGKKSNTLSLQIPGSKFSRQKSQTPLTRRSSTSRKGKHHFSTYSPEITGVTRIAHDDSDEKTGDKSKGLNTGNRHFVSYGSLGHPRKDD